MNLDTEEIEPCQTYIKKSNKKVIKQLKESIKSLNIQASATHLIRNFITIVTEWLRKEYTCYNFLKKLLDVTRAIDEKTIMSQQKLGQSPDT